MAEKIEEEKSLGSVQNLTCPLCLGIFDEATILTSCGHTFCRKCLKKYDLSHQDLDHMVCPLCRTITKLSANKVDDLRTNVTVNGLVDDYHGKCGGVNAVLEMRPNCTACKLQCESVSFCRTCSNYMCANCYFSHKQLTSFFEGHEIISIQDIIEGHVSIGHHSSEKCFTHKQENKDLFCEDCKVHVCLKCVIVGHQNHKIKNQTNFEQELRLKVNDLIQRCAAKKSELEKNIQNVEAQRHEVHTVLQKLQEDVIQAYSIKAKRLEENQRALIEQIDALQRRFDEDLDALKSNDRQRNKSICSSMTLVANDRLGRLETASLSAHTLLCEELDGMLKEATDHTSAAIITTKAQTNRFKPADDTRLDLGNISERDPEVQVIQCVDLRDSMFGMTKYSDDSVAIGYGNNYGIDIIHSAGTTHQYTNIPSYLFYDDLVFQQDRSLCISTSSSKVYIYFPKGSMKSAINVIATGYYIRLNRSPSDEIIVTNDGKQVYVYDPTGTKVRHTLQTEHKSSQASATREGLIITSSCGRGDVNRVTVYDREGNAGTPLQAPSDVYLYAAVDEQNRVYVASADMDSDKVVIRLYDIDGLNLKERVEFNALGLRMTHRWCYLVSLSPVLLAFACDTKLYFIKVSH